MRPTPHTLAVVVLISACGTEPTFESIDRHDPGGAARGALSEPPAGPWELDYYDVAWARALSLEEAGWRELDRVTLGEVQVVIGRWSAFEQPFAAGPDTSRILPWLQVGLLCLPSSPAEPATVQQALAYNVHDAIDRNPNLLGQWCVDVSTAFEIPVFIHGWDRDVVAALEDETYHRTQPAILARLFESTAVVDDDLDTFAFDGRFLVNGLPLVKGDLVALTVLQRLAAREWGADINEIGALGISKEGQAHWILGALDDRVAVLAPGGAYLGDAATLLQRWRRDWGCTLPGGGSDPLFTQAVRLMQWFSQTEVGAAAQRAFHPLFWSERIQARHVLVTADLGIPGQHDWIWPLLGEEELFSRTRHPSLAFTRIPDGSGIQLNDAAGELGRSILPHVADLLVNDAPGPAQPTTAHVVTEDEVTVRATGAAPSSATPPELFLVYATSSERTFRSGDTQWQAEPMRRDGGEYVVTVPRPAIGTGLVYYVLARELTTRNSLSFWKSSSSLPVEALRAPEPPPCGFPP